MQRSICMCTRSCFYGFIEEIGRHRTFIVGAAVFGADVDRPSPVMRDVRRCPRCTPDVEQATPYQAGVVEIQPCAMVDGSLIIPCKIFQFRYLLRRKVVVV
jgi:hypothetical protein